MRLVLKVLTSPDGCGLEGQTQAFEERGGSFGRGPANQWILPDPSRHISSVHGKIVFSAGQFSLVDESTNGIYLNDEEFPVGQGNQMALENGDQLSFGEYVLQVELDAQPEFSADTLVPNFGMPATETPAASPPDSFDDLDRWLDPVAPSAPSTPFSSSANGSSPNHGGSSHKLDDDLMGGMNATSDPTDPLAALDGAGKKSNFSSFPSKPEAGFSLDDLLGSPAPAQNSASAPAAQERMDLSKIAADKPTASPASFDKTAIRPEDIVAAPGAPAPTQVKPPAPTLSSDIPSHKDEAALADELENFLFGAETKSEPKPPAAPKPVSIEPKPAGNKGITDHVAGSNAIDDGDELVDDLDDFLKQPASSSAATVISTPATTTAKEAESEPLKAPIKAAAAVVKNEPPSAKVAAKSSKNTPVQMKKEASAKPLTQTKKSLNENEDADINAVLAAKLGLDDIPAAALPGLSDTVAQVVAESVKGLMINLRARNQVKSEFRLNMTMIQAAENNPLKFSVTPDDALENMFIKTGKAYMPPLEAVKDSFADIGDHQIALFDAMRSAYDHMLNQFDPEQIEAKNPATKSKGFLSSRKVNHWEQYKASFQQLTADRETTFKRTFGEVFAEAYERRMQELKVARIHASGSQ